MFLDERREFPYYGVMLSMQDNYDYLKSYVASDGNRYAECATCRRQAEVKSFDVETQDVPGWYLQQPGTNWFDKLKVYNPMRITLLKTTLEELATIWGITVPTIQRALDTGRLVRTDFRIYVVSHPWEPQTTCIDCRHPYQAPEVPEDSALVS